MVFLSGAIDLAKGEHRHNWRNEAKQKLNRFGITTVDPSLTFNYSKTGNAELDQITAMKLIDMDKYNMMMCDMTIMVLSKDVPSIGTPIEMYMLHEAERPLIVVWEGDMNFIPAYITGLVPRKNIVNDLDVAIEMVVDYYNQLKAMYNR